MSNSNGIGIDCIFIKAPGVMITHSYDGLIKVNMIKFGKFVQYASYY